MFNKFNITEKGRQGEENRDYSLKSKYLLLIVKGRAKTEKKKYDKIYYPKTDGTIAVDIECFEHIMSV